MVQQANMCDSLSSNLEIEKSIDQIVSSGIVRNHRCPVCDKAFGAKYALDRHLQSHSSEKSFSCGHCDYKCKTQNSLNTHNKQYHSKDSAEIQVSFDPRDFEDFQGKQEDNVDKWHYTEQMQMHSVLTQKSSLNQYIKTWNEGPEQSSEGKIPEEAPVTSTTFDIQ